MKTATRLMITAAACLAMTACSHKVKEQANTDTGNGTTGSTTGGIPGPGKYGPGDLDTDACLRQRVVYFDFDQDTLKPEFQATIACHAKYLRDVPEARVTLNGNADERGTREYNVALGERRGNAVSAALGGAPGQITVVSYGEEKPVCLDSNEDCWAKNRRVEFVYAR